MNILINTLFSTFEGLLIIMVVKAFSNHKNKTILSMLIGSIVYAIFVTSIGKVIPLGPHTLFIILFVVLINCTLFNTDILFSIFSTLVSILFMAIVDIILVSFIYFVLHISPMEAMNNNPFFLKCKIATHSFYLFVSFFLYKKNNLFNLRKKNYFTEKTNIIIIYILSISLLFLMLFFIILQFVESSDYRIVIFMILIFICLCIISLKINHYLMNLTKKEILLEEQTVYLEQIEELVKHLRTQKHEFGNHINMLYSLIQCNKEKSLESITKYIEDLNMDLKISSNLIQINEPLLSSILCTKMAVAEKKNIKIDMEITDTFENTTLSLPEITVILNNLLGNAIEFCENLDEKHRYICLFIYGKENELCISLSNENGNNKLDEKLIQKIFNQGFSTKSKTKNSRGFGLFNVKQIVEKHHGTIQVSSDMEQTVFDITLPKIASPSEISLQHSIRS